MNEAKHFVSVTNAHLPSKWINLPSIVSGNNRSIASFYLIILYSSRTFNSITVNPGQNEVRRRSDQSSVTIPYERSFRRIGSEYQPSDPEDLAQFQFCGCGWPQHMLLPKGTPDGAKFDLFVMVSDYTIDRTDDSPNL